MIVKFKRIGAVSKLSEGEKLDILNHLGMGNARKIGEISTDEDGYFDAVVIASNGMCCDEAIAKKAFALKLPTFLYQRNPDPRDHGFISTEFGQGERTSTGATILVVTKYIPVGDGTVVLH